MYRSIDSYVSLNSIVRMPAPLFRTSQVESDVWLGLSLFIDCCFAFDIILTFLSQVKDQNQLRINKPRVIARLYVRSLWFPIDVLSTIPFDRIIAAVVVGSEEERVADASQLLKALRLIRLTKVLRVLKLSRLVTKLQPRHRF